MFVWRRLCVAPLSRLQLAKSSRPRPDRADSCRRLAVKTATHENPSRRCFIRKLAGAFRASAKPVKSACSLRKQSPGRIRRTVENRNGKRPEQGRPVPPFGELGQIVGAHQPNETRLRDAPAQGENRLDRVTSAERALDGRGADGGPAGHRRRTRQARIERRHARIRFEGVLGRNEPPNGIQPEMCDGQKGDVPVTGVGRIERPAHQTDARPPPTGRQQAREVAVKRAGFAQGRVCPLP